MLTLILGLALAGLWCLSIRLFHATLTEDELWLELAGLARPPYCASCSWDEGRLVRRCLTCTRDARR